MYSPNDEQEVVCVSKGAINSSMCRKDICSLMCVRACVSVCAYEHLCVCVSQAGGGGCRLWDSDSY